jgi:hypothetical protein
MVYFRIPVPRIFLLAIFLMLGHSKTKAEAPSREEKFPTGLPSVKVGAEGKKVGAKYLGESFPKVSIPVVTTTRYSNFRVRFECRAKYPVEWIYNYNEVKVTLERSSSHFLCNACRNSAFLSRNMPNTTCTTSSTPE